MPGFAVTSLHLSHFRSHLTTKLQFDGKPVALTGANGAGKTNVLEAISLLSPGKGLRAASSEEFVRRPEALGWKISADVRSHLTSHQIETWAEPGQSRQTRIDGKATTQIALGKVMRILWLVPVMDRLWSEGAEARRRFLDRMTLSFFPDHAAAAVAYEKAMRQRNRLFRDNITDARWFVTLEARMAETAAQISANRAAALTKLGVAQADAVSVFPRAELAVLGPDAVSGDDFAERLAINRVRDGAAGRALSGPHRADLEVIFQDKGVAAGLCSTGEQKALLISLILSNARALAAETGLAPVLLLDEVAAHLDEARRAALYDEICDLGAQAFMTGTESGLFEALGARAEYLNLHSQTGISQVR